jgi:hypothetical protein
MIHCPKIAAVTGERMNDVQLGDEQKIRYIIVTEMYNIL